MNQQKELRSKQGLQHGWPKGLLKQQTGIMMPGGLQLLWSWSQTFVGRRSLGSQRWKTFSWPENDFGKPSADSGGEAELRWPVCSRGELLTWTEDTVGWWFPLFLTSPYWLLLWHPTGKPTSNIWGEFSILTNLGQGTWRGKQCGHESTHWNLALTSRLKWQRSSLGMYCPDQKRFCTHLFWGRCIRKGKGYQ